MAYKRSDTKDQTAIIPKWCGISGCQEKSSIVIRGTIGRCAKHYMDEVDKIGRSTVGKKIFDRLKLEIDEMHEIGSSRYIAESKKRREMFINGVTNES